MSTEEVPDHGTSFGVGCVVHHDARRSGSAAHAQHAATRPDCSSASEMCPRALIACQALVFWCFLPDLLSAPQLPAARQAEAVRRKFRIRVFDYFCTRLPHVVNVMMICLLPGSVFQIILSEADQENGALR